MLTHVHYCKYCDCSFDCTDKACGLFHELKHHACGERQAFIRGLRRMLGEVCKYNCNKPCSHPPKFQKLMPEEELPRMRPLLEPVTPPRLQPTILEEGSRRVHHEDCCCKICTKAFRKEISHA